MLQSCRRLVRKQVPPLLAGLVSHENQDILPTWLGARCILADSACRNLSSCGTVEGNIVPIEVISDRCTHEGRQPRQCSQPHAIREDRSHLFKDFPVFCRPSLRPMPTTGCVSATVCICVCG